MCTRWSAYREYTCYTKEQTENKRKDLGQIIFYLRFCKHIFFILKDCIRLRITLWFHSVNSQKVTVHQILLKVCRFPFSDQRKSLA